MFKKIEKIVYDNLENILALRYDFTQKKDGSYVSKGDLLVEKIVIQTIKEVFPTVNLISEETELLDVNFLNGHTVIIDPIDGTENFVSGLREWGIGISHYYNGTHQESFIMLPELHEVVKSGDKMIKINSRIAGISSSLSKEDLIKLDEGYEYRIIGCCMYNMLNVVKGSFATFENPKGANVWDILPGLNLAIENNLIVTVEGQKYEGQLLEPNRKYCFRISR